MEEKIIAFYNKGYFLDKNGDIFNKNFKKISSYLSNNIEIVSFRFKKSMIHLPIHYIIAYEKYGTNVLNSNFKVKVLNKNEKITEFNVEIISLKNKPKQCEKCGCDIDNSFGSGRFCSRKCASSFSANVDKDERLSKISKTLKKRIDKKCISCGIIFQTIPSKDNNCCSLSCSQKIKWNNENYRNNITNKTRTRCSSPEEKKRLRDIGRKGGFGNKGELENGIKYSSNFEKECFEFLIENNIEFTPHKNIPNSSKISDIYFKNIDLYIELDGINREKKNKWLKDEYKYWLDKLEIYKKQKLNYKILYNFKEFKNFILTEFK